MATCPKCGNQAGEGALFCDRCGTKLAAMEADATPTRPSPRGSVICSACGAGNVPGEAFCDFCGSPLEAPLPAVAELQPSEVEPAGLGAAASGAEAAPPGSSQAQAPAPSAGPEVKCPACGADVLPGEAFCDGCGASLAQAPIPPEPVEDADAGQPGEESLPAEPSEPAPPEPSSAAAAPEGDAVLPAGCPVCGQPVAPGDVFCSSCGASLKAAPAPAPEAVVPAPPSGGPRLIVAATGAEIPLPAKAEILIGREDPVSGIFPDLDLTPHGGEEEGVSRRHARLFVEGSDYFIEDLDSTNHTLVNKQRLTPRTRHPLKAGDEIRLGRLALLLKV